MAVEDVESADSAIKDRIGRIADSRMAGMAGMAGITFRTGLKALTRTMISLGDSSLGIRQTQGFVLDRIRSNQSEGFGEFAAEL